MPMPQSIDPNPQPPSDDIVVVFRTERARVQGRLVRLGASAETIIRAHRLADAGSVVLGEALAVAALLGSAVASAGDTLSVQTRTSGVVRIAYADCRAPGQLRGYVRIADAATDDQLGAAPGALIGAGHFAVTHDNATTGERYQGVIALDGIPLSQAVEAYFSARENLPTLARLVCARATSDAPWRAGGLIVQGPSAQASDDEDWSRIQMLASTVEAEELLDPTLGAERLLRRLLHEDGVVIENVVPLLPYCKCSRDRVLKVLASFGPTELSDMRDADGKISAKCEFCAKTYAFELTDIATPPEGGAL